MLEEVGTVIETEGEYAWIETERQGGCGACSSRQTCAGGSFASFFGQRPVRIRGRNGIGARPGERVLVVVQEAAVSQGSLMAYAVPLLGLLAGTGLGQLLAHRLGLAQPDAVAGVLGLIGLFTGLMGGRRIGARLGRDGRFEPVLTRRLPAMAMRSD